MGDPAAYVIEYLTDQTTLFGVVCWVYHPYLIGPEELHNNTGHSPAEVFVGFVKLIREVDDGELPPFQKLLCTSKRVDARNFLQHILRVNRRANALQKSYVEGSMSALIGTRSLQHILG